MTKVLDTPEKRARKARLFEIGVETLRTEGWTVERMPGGASMRVIRKAGQSRRASIRTTQDQWLAFPRQADDKGWVTLSEVDVVLAVSVDDAANPTSARVHWIEAADMRKRFDHAYTVRRKAGHSVPLGRGIWIPLYIADDGTPGHAGGGAGLDHPEIARVALASGGAMPQSNASGGADKPENTPLSIAEAKRRLSLSLGVPEASIKISIEA